MDKLEEEHKNQTQLRKGKHDKQTKEQLAQHELVLKNMSNKVEGELMKQHAEEKAKLNEQNLK